MTKPMIVAGSLAQRPFHGGHTWVFLQYLLGLKRLGFDVLFLDRLDETMCRQSEQSRCVRYLAQVMDQYGLGNAWSLQASGDTHGLARSAVLEKAREAPLLINVMGFLRDPEILALPRCRAFLDIDPGFGQMWRELGLANIFDGHDAFVTVAENIGKPGCGIPTCGLDWITTPQPVVLEHWPAQPLFPDKPFTSIASWRGRFGPIEYKNETFGLRVHEFRKFVQLPRLTAERFRLALDIDPAEEKDLALLGENKWSIVDPRAAATDPPGYQQFLRNSKAEFMVAKNMYVKTRGGWFSDRSICYLASGRPVLAQRTGWPHPEGRGLLGFSTLDEAVTGVKEISRDYVEHSRAARQIAEQCFDSDKVLSRLLEKLRVE